MTITVFQGRRSYIKRAILDYCIDEFESKQIWLVDSLQVFDPYFLSRADTQRSRLLLQSLKICRPFTFYQLRDKLYSFTKIPLSNKSTIIISGFDKFNDEVQDPEKTACITQMLSLLKSIKDTTNCNIIFGVEQQPKEIYSTFGEVDLWGEQLIEGTK